MELLRIHHEHFLSKNLRVDGRKFNEFRDMLINAGSIGTADSSITVKVGSTTVMCGIKVTINEEVKALDSVTYADLIDLKVSLHPLDEDIGERDEITSLLVKLIKENILFDHKPLISEDDDGEKQYLTLNIELICLNNDGNVFDAFIMAFLAAINSLQFPDYKDIYEEQSSDCQLPSALLSKKVNKETNLRRLNILKFPIGITSALMADGIILVDPNRDEEQLATGLLSVVFDIQTGSILILEKKGGTPMVFINFIKHLTLAKSIAGKFFETTPLFRSKGEAMET